MNLLDALLQLLRSFFKPAESGGAHQTGQGETAFGEAVALVEKEIGVQEKAFSEFASLKSAEIKHLLLELSRSADALEAQEISLEEGNKRFRQIVVTSQKNLARHLRGISRKIAPPQDASVEAMREYVPRALRALNSDLMPYWKNIALAKLMLKDEIKSIGGNMQEISDTLEEMRLHASSAALQRLYAMRQLAEKAVSSEGRQEELASRISSLKSSLSGLEKEASALRARKALLLGSNEARQLREAESEKAVLEAQRQDVISGFNSEIAPLEKVLKRLRSLSEHGDYLTAKEKDVLSMLLTSPFSAFASDPNGLNCKAILVKAEKLVSDGSISLKEDELEKRLALISGLLSRDFFSDYFWRVNRIQAQANLLEKRAAGMDVSGKLASLDREAEAVERGIAEAEEKLASLSRDSAAGKPEEVKREFAAEFNSFFRGGHAAVHGRE